MHASIRRAVAEFSEGEGFERHFNLAAERIQSALLNVAIPHIGGIRIGVHAEPARLVGGDYIDLFVHEEGALVFGLGDASGKSLAAALNALMLRYLVRGLIAALGPRNLVSIVTHTNEVVTDDLTDGAFITFLLGTFDEATEKLTVVNAGHEPPLIYRNNAATAETLNVHDIVLGVHKATQYLQEEIRLNAGDTVVLYTDGLTEASNDKGELFTIECLKDELLKCAHLPAEQIAATIFEAVKAYAAGPLRDDATILVLQRP